MPFPILAMLLQKHQQNKQNVMNMANSMPPAPIPEVKNKFSFEGSERPNFTQQYLKSSLFPNANEDVGGKALTSPEKTMGGDEKGVSRLGQFAGGLAGSTRTGQLVKMMGNLFGAKGSFFQQ